MMSSFLSIQGMAFALDTSLDLLMMLWLLQPTELKQIRILQKQKEESLSPPTDFICNLLKSSWSSCMADLPRQISNGRLVFTLNLLSKTPLLIACFQTWLLIILEVPGDHLSSYLQYWLLKRSGMITINISLTRKQIRKKHGLYVRESRSASKLKMFMLATWSCRVRMMKCRVIWF